MLARAWSALALLMMALLERARGVAARQPFGGAGMSGKGTWFSLVSYATAVCWIFSNERSAVQCTGLWDRAKRAVLSVGKPADVPAGALAHTVGTAVSEKKIADSTTGVETPSPAIMMRRVVEQYQWKEESRGRKHKVQIHTYDKIWSRSLLDSSKYVDMEAHVNPPTMLLRGMTKAPDGVLVNGFALQHSLLIQLAPAAYERFAVAPDEIKLPPSLGIRVLGKAPDGRIYMRKTEQVKRQEIVVGEEAAAAEDAKKNKGFLGRSVYISGNTLAAPEGDDERLSHFEPWNRPLIGDMRIYWECAAPQQVAVMAKHAGGGALEPWGGLGAGPKTNAPATSQEAVFTLNMGESSASGLVSDATSAIGSEIWEARAFGFGSTTMGSFIFCFFQQWSKDFSAVLSLIPLVGEWLAWLKPSLRSIPAGLAIPVVSAALAAMLIIFANVFWRVWFAIGGLCSSGPSDAAGEEPAAESEPAKAEEAKKQK